MGDILQKLMSKQRSFLSSLKQRNGRERALLALKVALVLISIGILITVFVPITSFCSSIIGDSYRSTKEIENILGGTMYPEVHFGNGTFTWVISDMVIAGVYQCKSGEITAMTSYNSQPVSVFIQPDTDFLIWQGQEYRRVPR